MRDDMTPPRRGYSRIVALANGTELRTARYQGRDHLVVPFVALVGNSVVRPFGSTGPEFIPAHVLAVAPGGWNGRPVMPDHPHNGTGSANDPSTLEALCFGQLFNTRYSDGRLLSEAYIDAERADRIGGVAAEVVSRLRAGETVEVSVGAYVTFIDAPGTYRGESYVAAWDQVTPDHLAMLPAGTIGACSVDMGCGAPRAAQHTPIAAAAVMRVAEESTDVSVTPAPATGALESRTPVISATEAAVIESMRRAFEMRAAASPEDGSGTSDTELRRSLSDALRAVEPGYWDVLEVFPDSRTVIYVAAPEDRVLYLRRTYKRRGDNITLNDDRTEVEPITRWEAAASLASTSVPVTSSPVVASTVAAADTLASGAGGCSCNQGHGQAAQPTAATSIAASSAASTGADTGMTEVTELVGRLLALQGSPFTDADRAKLEGLSASQLEAMVKGLSGTPAPAPTPAQAPTAAPSTPTTPAEWLAAAPAEVRDLVNDYQERDRRERNDVIESILRVQSSNAYTREALATMPTPALRTLATALNTPVPARDYSQRVVPMSNNQLLPLPDTYGLSKVKGGSGAATTGG